MGLNIEKTWNGLVTNISTLEKTKCTLQSLYRAMFLVTSTKSSPSLHIPIGLNFLLFPVFVEHKCYSMRHSLNFLLDILLNTLNCFLIKKKALFST